MLPTSLPRLLAAHILTANSSSSPALVHDRLLSLPVRVLQDGLPHGTRVLAAVGRSWAPPAALAHDSLRLWDLAIHLVPTSLPHEARALRTSKLCSNCWPALLLHHRLLALAVGLLPITSLTQSLCCEAHILTADPSSSALQLVHDRLCALAAQLLPHPTPKLASITCHVPHILCAGSSWVPLLLVLLLLWCCVSIRGLVLVTWGAGEAVLGVVQGALEGVVAGSVAEGAAPYGALICSVATHVALAAVPCRQRGTVLSELLMDK